MTTLLKSEAKPSKSKSLNKEEKKKKRKKSDDGAGKVTCSPGTDRFLDSFAHAPPYTFS
jgi:hypothetical protein